MATSDKELAALKQRVKKLEEQVFGMAQFSTKEVSSNNKEEPGLLNEFFTWLKEDWLMKLGAFLLILALGWFVTYAFLNNWIGPIGRISLGILAGAGIMAVGHLTIQKRNIPGQVLTVTGGTMILLTIYAARSVYGFFTPNTALFALLVVDIAVALLAILHKARFMGLMAVFGAFITPLLTLNPVPDYFGLAAYIAIINVGVLALVSTRSWRFLTPIALFLTALYSIELFDNLQRSDSWLFIGIYFSLFFLAGLGAMYRSKKAQVADLLAASLNGFLLLIWTWHYVPLDWRSIVLSVVAVIIIFASVPILKVKSLSHPLYINTGTALVLIAAAAAFEFEGPALTIALSLEALAAVLAAAFVIRKKEVTTITSILQFVPVIIALPSLSLWNWEKGILINDHFFVILISILSLSATALILKNLQIKMMSVIHTVLAGLFGIGLVWISSHVLIESPNTARGIALVIYTLSGVGLFFSGITEENLIRRRLGTVLLAAVVLRLLFVEVWIMSLAARIITFVAIGALLVATAFAGKKDS